MAVLPPEIAGDRKLCIVSRLYGKPNDWGSKADIYEMKDGKLILTDLA